MQATVESLYTYWSRPLSPHPPKKKGHPPQCKGKGHLYWATKKIAASKLRHQKLQPIHFCLHQQGRHGRIAVGRQAA